MSVSIFVVGQQGAGNPSTRVVCVCVCDFLSEGVLCTFPALVLHMRDVKLLFSVMRSSVTSIG